MEPKDAMKQWEHCYDDSWKGIIVAEAFRHPAKFSKALVERIIDYMLEKEWLRQGETIGDTFGGVGLGGVIAAYKRLRWVGVELEPPFVQMGHDNFTLHRTRWRAINAPQPCIIQGDSRYFDKVLQRADAMITSPPYVSGGHHNDVFDAWNVKSGGQGITKETAGYGKSEGQIGRLKEGAVDAVVTSPPFLRAHGGERGIMIEGLNTKDGRSDKKFARRQYRDQDRAAGNIEALKDGKVDAVISSPPYAEIAAGAGGLNTKPAKRPGQQSGRKPRSPSQSADQRYGNTEGQIAKAKKGKVDAVLTSPPYEDSVNREDHGFDFMKAKPDYPTRNNHPRRVAMHKKSKSNFTYGNAAGQIGALKKQTYWEAMHQVYSSMFRALKHGGVAAIVVKDFVRNGRRMTLCDDTVLLLNHVGFVTIERIRAMLTREYEVPDLFEGTTTKRKDRKSFFRRVAESKMPADDPRRIDWEEVIFVRKP